MKICKLYILSFDIIPNSRLALWSSGMILALGYSSKLQEAPRSNRGGVSSPLVLTHVSYPNNCSGPMFLINHFLLPFRHGVITTFE